MAQPKAHVSELKKRIVKKLDSLITKKTVMVASITNLPASQFQEIRKKTMRMFGWHVCNGRSFSLS